MMKKLLKNVALVAALIATANVSAQVAINFGGEDYTNATVAADLGSHPDWLTQGVATVNGLGQVSVGNNWNALVYQNAIKATVGETVTVSFGVTFGTDTEDLFNLEPNKNNSGFYGLKTDSTTAIPGDAREGVNVQLRGSDDGEFASNFNMIVGTGIQFQVPFPDSRTANIFTIEYIIGADAASTVKNVTMTDGIETGTASVTGILENVYNAITGDGAYFYYWPGGWAQTGVLSRLFLDQVELSNVTLSDDVINKTSIASLVTVSEGAVTVNADSDVYVIKNIAGQTVASSASNTIDVSGLASGVYYVITDAGVAKFVK